MKSALADMLAVAIGDQLFEDLEVRAVGEGEAWRTVPGEVKRGAVVQEFNGMAAKQVVGADEVHLMASDFTSGLPKKDWWVRELSGPNVGRVMRLAEPARVSGRSGRFLMAPLRPHSGDVPE